MSSLSYIAHNVIFSHIDVAGAREIKPPDDSSLCKKTGNISFDANAHLGFPDSGKVLLGKGR